MGGPKFQGRTNFAEKNGPGPSGGQIFPVEILVLGPFFDSPFRGIITFSLAPASHCELVLKCTVLLISRHYTITQLH